ncbi:MAG: RHS repeat-associated core domain-containing protein [Ferruginibacter sp.]
MQMPGRKYSSSIYRFGFNGKENDSEGKGEGNQQDYGMRIYDIRLGKFLSIDPLTKNYPWYTPYQFAGNKPTWDIDFDGMEERIIGERTKLQYEILTGSGVSHEEACKAVYENSKTMGLAVASSIPGILTGGSSNVGTGITVLKTMAAAGVTGASVNMLISWVEGGNGYEIVKSGISGFVSGSLLGGLGKISFIKNFPAVNQAISGAISGAAGEITNQVFDLTFGEDSKGVDLQKIFLSAGIGGVANVIAPAIIKKTEALIDKTSAKYLAATMTKSYRDLISKTIKEETPRIGPTLLKKEINKRIAESRRLILEQTKLNKIAVQKTIERVLDYLQVQTTK